MRWTFPGLELTVIACSVLAAVDALRRRERLAVFVWLAAFCYGLAIEILSYNFLDNFTHARFTVMLYHGKLPLYVSALYPLFIYTGWAGARRLGLGRVAEPFAAGLAIVLLDVPFDILGPRAGWWTWSAADPNLRARWLGVPVTSYLWHLTFGGSLVFLARSLEPLLRRARAALLLAPMVGAATLVAGVLCFLPFHGLRALGVPDEATVALYVAAAALVVARARPRPGGPRLIAVPLLYHGFFAAVALATATELPVILAATALSLALHLATMAR